MQNAIADRHDARVDLKPERSRSNELYLVYQPTFRLEGDRKVGGVEALLRWQHPTRGTRPARHLHPDRGGQRP